MARKASKRAGSGAFASFDVFYEDGSRSSNRKVPASALGGLDGDAPAQAILEEQDRKLSEMSGRPKPKITAVKRSGT